MNVLDGFHRILGSAYSVFLGRHGEVSQKSRQEERSRQSIYREANKVANAISGDQQQALIAQLQTQLSECQEQLGLLESRCAQSIEMTDDMQAEFAATAQAEGVSLPVARRLLKVIDEDHALSVPTLGRMTRDSAKRSAACLEVLDSHAHPKARQSAADEIFLARNQS